MSIYNIDFKQRVIDWLPPDKRMTKFVRFLQSLTVSVKNLSYKLFTDYKLGSSYPILEIGDSYGKGDKVNYRGVVYESLTDVNTTLPPNASWRLYLPSFIGVDTRVQFNSQKLALEYALNIRFNQTFRQPPLIGDIYIELLYPTGTDNVVGADGSRFYIGQTFGRYAANGLLSYYEDGYNMLIWCPMSMNVGGSFGLEPEIYQFVKSILPYSIIPTIGYY